MAKDQIISFKIEPDAKELFDKLCSEKHTTPSQELRAFVHQSNKQLKVKRIPLNTDKFF